MGKFIEHLNITTAVDELKSEGLSIVIIGGVFDIVHPLHVEILKSVQKRYGTVVVNILNDKRVLQMKNYKANKKFLVQRPIMEERDRAAIISALESVTIATVHPSVEFSPTVQLVSEIKPSVYVIESPLPENEMKFLKITTPETKIIIGEKHPKRISSTQVIQRVIQSYKNSLAKN